MSEKLPVRIAQALIPSGRNRQQAVNITNSESALLHTSRTNYSGRNQAHRFHHSNRKGGLTGKARASLDTTLLRELSTGCDFNHDIWGLANINDKLPAVLAIWPGRSAVNAVSSRTYVST